jgi:hypothetical protein
MSRTSASFCGTLAIALTAVLWTASPAAAQYRYAPGGYQPRDYYQSHYQNPAAYSPHNYYRPDVRYQPQAYSALPYIPSDVYSPRDYYGRRYYYGSSRSYSYGYAYAPY